jgi:hypothetical protein
MAGSLWAAILGSSVRCGALACLPRTARVRLSKCVILLPVFIETILLSVTLITESAQTLSNKKLHPNMREDASFRDIPSAIFGAARDGHAQRIPGEGAGPITGPKRARDFGRWVLAAPEPVARRSFAHPN